MSPEPAGTVRFSGHFSLSSQGPSHTCLGRSSPGKSQEDREQEGRGPHFQRPPSSLSPVLQGLEEAPCRVWLSSPPSLSWSLSCPTRSWGCCPKRTNRVWGRHILAGSPWRLLPQGCSIHPRSRQQPWLPPPQPAMGPHQPGPTPWTTQSLTVQNSR